MIWNRAVECMSRDELAALQGKRLVELVRYMYQNTRYYKNKMMELGLEPCDIQEIGDLEKLPFTTKGDLLEEYPSGVFAMPGSKIVHYQTSDHKDGHYAGMETVAGYTQNDLKVWKECMARSISMAGLGEKDVIQAAYGHGVCADGFCAQYGVEKIGAAVAPASADQPAVSVALMRRLHVTGLISTPSYLTSIAKVIGERSLKNKLWLRAALCGGKPWKEDIREKIQDELGMMVHDIFGLNELTGLGVACECEHQNGMHVQEDFFMAEILDTCKNHVLPGGKKGELVFTTLQKEGVPLIRYQTGNVTRINYEKCECGRTMARIDRICEGADDMLLIRGNSVFVYQIEEALSGLQDIEYSYTMCIRKEHGLDVVDLFIENYIENFIENGRIDKESAKRRVADAVCGVIGMMPDVYCAKSGVVQIPEEGAAGGKVMIVDRRRQK